MNFNNMNNLVDFYFVNFMHSFTTSATHFRKEYTSWPWNLGYSVAFLIVHFNRIPEYPLIQ